MTSTEPMTYKPGPELDARLGRAFGWSVEYDPGWGPPIYVNQEKHSWEQVPQFSTTWDGMKLVIKEIQRRFGGCDIGCYSSKDGSEWYTATIVLASGKEIIRTMQTAPHAVAEACLSAIQSNTEELDT